MKLRNEAFRIFFMWALPLRKKRGSAGRDVCIRVEHTPELLKRQVKLMLVRRERDSKAGEDFIHEATRNDTKKNTRSLFVFFRVISWINSYPPRELTFGFRLNAPTRVAARRARPVQRRGRLSPRRLRSGRA